MNSILSRIAPQSTRPGSNRNVSNENTSTGKLIWESRTEKQVSRPMLFFIGGVFLLMALAAGYQVVPSLFKTIPLQDELGRKLGVGLMLLCVFIGGFLTYQGFRPPKPPRGVIFFERGVEFGTPRKRRFIEYGQLQTFRFEPISKNLTSVENVILGVRVAMSLIALSPNGIVYAIVKLSVERPKALVVFQPLNERTFSVPVFKDGLVKLGSYFTSQKKANS